MELRSVFTLVAVSSCVTCLVAWLTEIDEINPNFNERVGPETEDSLVDKCKSDGRHVCLFCDSYGVRL